MLLFVSNITKTILNKIKLIYINLVAINNIYLFAPIIFNYLVLFLKKDFNFVKFHLKKYK